MLTQTKEYIKLGFKIITLFLIGVLITAITTYYLKERKVSADEKKRKAMYSQILEGKSIGPSALTVDFHSSFITGSPLIFGGNHSPDVEHQDAWDQTAEIGVTVIRTDLFPEKTIPNTTLTDYKNNKNGVANTKNWNQNELKKIKDIFLNAHKRNMKTIGILAYTPGWLTYTNTGNGIPKDWEVFKDIAKKSYRIHRENLDYIEIWNEPTFDYFFNLTGSNLSREAAYTTMFKNAVEAIREVDKEMNDGKRIKIGGPVSHRPFDTSLLEAILQNPELRKELDFISYHNYDAEHLTEPSDIHFRRVLDKYNLGNIPIFITEWNYQPNDNKPEPRNTGVEALIYTSNKFIDFLKMGLEGANYHVLEPVNKRRPNGGVGYYGFYNWENAKAILQLQARSWRILSKKMGLGNGSSKIYQVLQVFTNGKDSSVTFNTIGIKNSEGQYGVVLVNNSRDTQVVEITLKNTSITGFTKVQAYYASINHDALQPQYEGFIKANKGKINFTYYIPAESVLGITFTEEKEWYDILQLPLGK